MEDALDGGLRLPPSMCGDGVGIRGLDSGGQVVLSGDLNTHFLKSDFPIFEVPTSNREAVLPAGALDASMEEGECMHGASLGSCDGKTDLLPPLFGDHVQAENDGTGTDFMREGNGSLDADCMLLQSSGCLPNSSLPPPSECGTSFHNGSTAAPSILSAHSTRPLGVCGNAGKLLSQQNGPSSPWSNMNMAWKKPSVVPLPSSNELGCFSMDDDTAILDEAAVDATLKKFDAALVGRMFGRRIPYLQLANELSRRWDVFGKFRLVTLSGDCFVCFFDKVEARDAVLMGGPWVLFGQVLGVDKWTSTFSPSSSEGFATPVWIRMPGLPFYCWSSTNIARIAALVGEPLWLDSATDKLEKGMFARACVRIDLSKPLKPGVWVQGRHGKFFQALVYEGLSVFCFRCCQVGHKENTCKVQAACRGKNTTTPSPSLGSVRTSIAVHDGSAGSMQAQDVVIQEVDPSTSDIRKNIPSDDAVQPEDRGAGPWMIVQRNKRSPRSSFPGNSRGPSFGQPTFDARRSKGKTTPLGSSPPPQSSYGSGVELLSGGSSSPSFSGFSALAEGTKARSPRTIKAQLARSSRTFKERMVSDLGPVAHGSRKRHKAHSLTDGGDGSPSPQP